MDYDTEATTWGTYNVTYYERGRKLAIGDTLGAVDLNATIKSLGKSEGLIARCISQGHVPLVVVGLVDQNDLPK